MLYVTSSMIEEFDLPPELSSHFFSGNMSQELRKYYEPVVGAAVKKAFQERPALLQEVLTGAAYAETASERGMTVTEYFFGLEPGYESICDSSPDPQSVLGMLLLRDEPIEHLRVFRESVLREYSRPHLEWGEVWRCRSSSDDWFELWTQSMFASKYLATVIRMGLPSDDCFRFMAGEKMYLELGLRGVPLTYALACDTLSPETIRSAWESGLPAEYARVLVG